MSTEKRSDRAIDTTPSYAISRRNMLLGAGAIATGLIAETGLIVKNELHQERQRRVEEAQETIGFLADDLLADMKTRGLDNDHEHTDKVPDFLYSEDDHQLQLFSAPGSSYNGGDDMLYQVVVRYHDPTTINALTTLDEVERAIKASKPSELDIVYVDGDGDDDFQSTATLYIADTRMSITRTVDGTTEVIDADQVQLDDILHSAHDIVSTSINDWKV